MSEVFHSGELAVQKMAGQSDMAQRVGRMISSEIMGQAIPFIEQQNTAYLGSVDQDERLWVSLLVGKRGFVEVAHERGVIFHEPLIQSTDLDVFYQNITHNPEVGVLFMEPEFRRRYRVNGPLRKKGDQLLLNVREAFGNCPKYIQASTLTLPEDRKPFKAETQFGSALTAALKAWVSQADTFVMATRSAAGKIDTSHRGGRPGFVEMLADGRLRIPDYPGNSLFQTLGNIYENPNTGLLFVDFEKGETLQLSGKAELAFDQTSQADLDKSGETGRFWLFEIEHWRLTRQHHQVDWAFLSYSPFNP